MRELYQTELPRVYNFFRYRVGNGPLAISTWDTAWSEVHVEAVETVQVKGLPGEYVQGMFVSRDGKTASWEAEAPVQRLRWREGDMWFEIQLAGQTAPVEYLDRDGLIALAESLK